MDLRQEQYKRHGGKKEIITIAQVKDEEGRNLASGSLKLAGVKNI